MDRKNIDEKKQQKLEGVKSLLQAFVDAGNSIEDLGTHDTAYKEVKATDIFVNGRRLTLEEKLQYLGFPRKPKLSSEDKINEIKILLDNFVANGGTVNDLRPGNHIYDMIHNLNLSVKGRRLTVEEKFTLVGHPRESKQNSFEEKLKKLKAILDKFVEEGGNVNDLKPGDKFYEELRNFTPTVNGRRLTTEEKFEWLGHPRKPIYEDMESFMIKLSALKNFQDENGCVDSYRKDESMKQAIAHSSILFGFPPALVICMLADQKLEKYVVYTNRTEFLRTALTRYLETHKDFHGIRRGDPQLYALLCSIAKSYPTENGKRITNLELIESLGFENVPNAFYKEGLAREFLEAQFIAKYAPIAQKNNGILSYSDIESSDNTALLFHLKRTNQTKTEFLAKHNIQYSHPRVIDHNKRITLPEYPYLDEMQEKVTRILTDFYKMNPEFEHVSASDAFALKADVIRSVYEEYKHKIESKYILPSLDESSQEKQ